MTYRILNFHQFHICGSLLVWELQVGSAVFVAKIEALNTANSAHHFCGYENAPNLPSHSFVTLLSAPLTGILRGHSAP